MNTHPESQMIKRCPFCGGEAMLTGLGYDGPADCYDVYVQCSICDSEGQSKLVDKSAGWVEADSVSEAIAAWNRRPAIHSQEAAAPSGELFYRPDEYDDWGLIRTKDGKVFASVRRPLDEIEAYEHRKNKTDPFEDLARRIISSFASPAPVAVAPVGVSVKALEWTGPNSNSEWHTKHSLIGYAMYPRMNGFWLSEVGQHVDNLQQGYALAQADFNARILSSIIPAAKAAVGVEAAETLRKAMMFECADCTKAGVELNCHPASATFLVGSECICEDCYSDGDYAKSHRIADLLPFAALSGGIETPTQAAETTYGLVNKLRSRWGFGPHCRDTLPVEWQKGLDEAADAIAALHLEVDQRRLQKNKLVLAAYPAMDAIDAIRKWCDEQPYANDTITVSRLRDKLPTSGGTATPKPEGAK